MANHSPGTKVFDKITGKEVTILKTTTKKEDYGRWHVYYLTDAEHSDNYPSGWRNDYEVSIRGVSQSRA